MRDSRMRKIHPMMSIDIENYSDRNEAQQHEAQGSLRLLLETAAREAGLDLTAWATQWSGDGAFAVLPADTPIGELAEAFIQELNVLLGTRNRRPLPPPWTSIRLRVSLHEGPVRTDGATGIPGSHAVQVNRLVDAEALRVALACCHGADLAMIVSERVFNDYLTDGYGALSPARFRQVRVAVKENRYLAYLYVPNCDLFRIHELDPFNDIPALPHEDRGPRRAGATSAEPPSSEPRKIVYGSAHTITGSNVNETHSGDIRIGDINLGGPR
ncbi:hypothetical protein ACBI99_45010 [Nonomuraea sp. ATR24]|uniref:hypothetical protein n=1 Tax=Nonomuraea sp. ATR24 TaxID=1676744 RepID=UPI0035C06E92